MKFSASTLTRIFWLVFMSLSAVFMLVRRNNPSAMTISAVSISVFVIAQLLATQINFPVLTGSAIYLLTLIYHLRIINRNGGFHNLKFPLTILTQNNLAGPAIFERGRYPCF